jgi:hypothetical protein
VESETFSCPECGADVSKEIDEAFKARGWTLKGPLAKGEDASEISVTCANGHRCAYKELKRSSAAS